MKGKNDLFMSYISKWINLLATHVVIFGGWRTLQFSCRFHDLQLLHLTAPIEQWNLEDLIWAYFGRISIDFRQYYVLFNLEWFHISWREQLARITTFWFPWLHIVQKYPQPPSSHCQKEKRVKANKLCKI